MFTFILYSVPFGVNTSVTFLFSAVPSEPVMGSVSVFIGARSASLGSMMSTALRIDAHQRTAVGLQLDAVVLGSLLEDDLGNGRESRQHLIGTHACARLHLPGQLLVGDNVLASLR